MNEDAKSELLAIENVRAIIERQEPLPGMFEFIAKFTRHVFLAEERIAQVFCKRNGIEPPPKGSSIKEQMLFLRDKVSMNRVTFIRPPGLPPDSEFIIQQSWCSDLREDPENRSISWPQVVVTLANGNNYKVAIHDPDSRATPELYADLEVVIT